MRANPSGGQPNDEANERVARANNFARHKQYDDALIEYEKALALNPDLAEAWLGRGNVYAQMSFHSEAIFAFGNALALKSEFLEALLGRANVLVKIKAYDEATAVYDRLLKIKSFPEAWLGLGNAFFASARYEAAAVAYTNATAEQYVPPFAQGALLDSKMHICDWRDFYIRQRQLIAGVRDGNLVADPLAFFNISSVAADQLKCARIFGAHQSPPAASPLWRGERYSHDRIRVAYISADLRDHATSFLLAGVFEHHDKAKFETIAVSLCRDAASQMRQRLIGAFDRFFDLDNENDQKIANLLRELEVDIAVDLMGHTASARCGIFAQRPAPVQVGFIGYPGTSGLDYIDYIIADRFVIPESERRHYTEQVVYLPDCFQPNDSRRFRSPYVPSRTDVGLPEAGFVFCAMNSVRKITPALFDCWMRLLGSVDGSLLWMAGGATAAESNLRREAEQRSVDPGRIIFAPRLPYPDHLARYAPAELFLDTFPCNGGATASDALWAGIPLITCAGEGFASRMAASLLHALELDELIANSMEDYEKLALKFARDPALLARTREKLARNRNSCALFDTERFTRHLEAAYTIMSERIRLGQPAAVLSVRQ